MTDQTGTAEVMGALSDKPLPEVKCRQCLMAWPSVKCGCVEHTSKSMAQGRVVWGLGGPWDRAQEGLQVVAVTGCLRGRWLQCVRKAVGYKCMAQGGLLVWPGGPRARVVLLCQGEP